MYVVRRDSFSTSFYVFYVYLPTLTRDTRRKSASVISEITPVTPVTRTCNRMRMQSRSSHFRGWMRWWRELRLVYGVCNPIKYSAFSHLSSQYACARRIRYVCYGFVSIGYWGTKQQRYHFFSQIFGALPLLCFVSTGRRKHDTDTEPDLTNHKCGDVLRVIRVEWKQMENRWHRFTFDLIYFNAIQCQPRSKYCLK